MIYTIGHAQRYLDMMRANGTRPVLKSGKSPSGYYGGEVFATEKDAAAFISTLDERLGQRGFAVFGIEADWDRETYALPADVPAGLWNRHLLESKPLVLLAGNTVRPATDDSVTVYTLGHAASYLESMRQHYPDPTFKLGRSANLNYAGGYAFCSIDEALSKREALGEASTWAVFGLKTSRKNTYSSHDDLGINLLVEDAEVVLLSGNTNQLTIERSAK